MRWQDKSGRHMFTTQKWQDKSGRHIATTQIRLTHGQNAELTRLNQTDMLTQKRQDK